MLLLDVVATVAGAVTGATLDVVDAAAVTEGTVVTGDGRSSTGAATDFATSAGSFFESSWNDGSSGVDKSYLTTGNECGPPPPPPPPPPAAPELLIVTMATCFLPPLSADNRSFIRVVNTVSSGFINVCSLDSLVTVAVVAAVP